MKRFVWITTQKAAVHSYPTPPAVVGFLQYPHRHLFKFKILIQVFHTDREIEFLLLQSFIEDIIEDINKSPDHTYSCEMISDLLHSAILEQYCENRDREIRIEVSEDGENGSYIEY